MRPRGLGLSALSQQTHDPPLHFFIRGIDFGLPPRESDRPT